jgi:hypothetical protein
MARPHRSVLSLGCSTMPLTFDQILEGFAALKPEDFDYMRPDSDGLERLGTLTDDLMTLPQCPQVLVPQNSAA